MDRAIEPTPNDATSPCDEHRRQRSVGQARPAVVAARSRPTDGATPLSPQPVAPARHVRAKRRTPGFSPKRARLGGLPRTPGQDGADREIVARCFARARRGSTRLGPVLHPHHRAPSRRARLRCPRPDPRPGAGDPRRGHDRSRTPLPSLPGRASRGRARLLRTIVRVDRRRRCALSRPRLARCPTRTGRRSPDRHLAVDPPVGGLCARAAPHRGCDSLRSARRVARTGEACRPRRSRALIAGARLIVRIRRHDRRHRRPRSRTAPERLGIVPTRARPPAAAGVPAAVDGSGHRSLVASRGRSAQRLPAATGEVGLVPAPVAASVRAELRPSIAAHPSPRRMPLVGVVASPSCVSIIAMHGRASPILAPFRRRADGPPTRSARLDAIPHRS